ncbi:GH1 family beta-glucosidase [Luteimicrobium subarcticum]|uniref:Beta-glucosidase n=1 Tax=Luteimicrobium subarcticum TaxID=620910 RepID=A0A2M8WR73_9MICO|nr:GH1 family beta-glucosidase [Luteimicrobium subarcticum]PJI93404.1 beta-glucosidase [Luteimicrobium subarcticum]
MTTQRTFPDDFVWGSATAAYQIEGAADEGGRGPSIWDTFSRTPGKTLNGDTGDVADDHYHRWAEDVEHIANLGLDAYRLSISWPRVQPGGSGEFNEEGIAFYRTLVAALAGKGVKPVVTLYHWDLPQELEDAGGWVNRDTAYLFAEYARRMARELGDTVDVWTTLNEPWCSAYLGYASGVHAPGRTDGADALAAVHHLNLAHGLAVQAIRAELGPQAKASITLNLHVTRADDPSSEADLAAVRKIDAVANEAFLGPILEGAYPEDLLANTAHVTDWAFVQDGDLDEIRQPLDVLGVNYYSTGRVRHFSGEGERQQADGHADSDASPWVGITDVEFLPQPGPHTAMGWNIEPQGMTDLLVSLHERFPHQPLMVTENGAAFADEVSPDGAVHDPLRVSYLHDHIDAVGEARDAGADVRGYFAWSLLDNFEWSYGYERRFGIIRVDYDTLERTWKDSAHWYRRLAATSVLPDVDDVAPLS